MYHLKQPPFSHWNLCSIGITSTTWYRLPNCGNNFSIQVFLGTISSTTQCWLHELKALSTTCWNGNFPREGPKLAEKFMGTTWTSTRLALGWSDVDWACSPVEKRWVLQKMRRGYCSSLNLAVLLRFFCVFEEVCGAATSLEGATWFDATSSTIRRPDLRSIPSKTTGTATTPPFPI